MIFMVNLLSPLKLTGLDPPIAGKPCNFFHHKPAYKNWKPKSESKRAVVYFLSTGPNTEVVLNWNVVVNEEC